VRKQSNGQQAHCGIFFLDQGRFGLMPCTGRIWYRKGMRATALVKPGYSNFYLYAAVNPFTGEAFTLQLPMANTEMMNLYLAALRKAYPQRPLLLVLDRAGWHRSKRLEVPEGIDLEHLPSYSPELNPVEKLWQWLRREVCRNRIFETLDDLEEALFAAWQQFTPSFFSSLCRCSYL